MRADFTILASGVPMDALRDLPATRAGASNALHLIYGDIQSLRLNVGDVASRIAAMEFLPSSSSWAQESLTVADDMLKCASDIEHTAISSAMKILNNPSKSARDAIGPLARIANSALAISISATTQIKAYRYIPAADEGALLVVNHFRKITEVATSIAKIARADIAALQNGVKRVRWLSHLNSPTAGQFRRAQ